MLTASTGLPHNTQAERGLSLMLPRIGASHPGSAAHKLVIKLNHATDLSSFLSDNTPACCIGDEAFLISRSRRNQYVPTTRRRRHVMYHARIAIRIIATELWIFLHLICDKVTRKPDREGRPGWSASVDDSIWAAARFGLAAGRTGRCDGGQDRSRDGGQGDVGPSR